MDLSAYLDLFVAEAREPIAVAAGLAAKVDERDAGEAELRELFRHVHSVKGMAASMGFEAMSSLAHDAESLMDLVRQRQIEPKATTRRILSDALVCLERMVDRAESKEPVDDAERAPLQESLRGLLQGAGDTGAVAPLADPGGSARPMGTPEPTTPAGCVKLA